MSTESSTPSQPPADKPTITRLEAERRLAMARHQGLQEAQATGGDPAAVGALMASGNGPPTIAGRVLHGVLGNSYTVGCMVAQELLEAQERSLDPKLSNAERSIAWLIILEDPFAAWQMLQQGANLDQFRERIRQIVFEDGITQVQLKAINEGVHQLIAPSLPKEDAASFPTPATTPATSTPLTTSET